MATCPHRCEWSAYYLINTFPSKSLCIQVNEKSLKREYRDGIKRKETRPG